MTAELIMNTIELNVLAKEAALESGPLDELEALTEAQLALVGGGQGLFTM
jgi:hypothetical protein